MGLSKPATVLVVDDSDANLKVLRRLLTAQGYEVVTATNAEEALALLQRDRPDLVLSDVMMPGLNGFELCLRIKKDPATRLLPVVLLTGLQATDDRIAGIDAGADDFLSKPFNNLELAARVRSLLRLKRYTDDLDSAEAVILSLALTIEARDPYTDGHCQRLAQSATALGRRLGLSEDDVAALGRGGYLHDIGKIGVPDAILFKPGPLTAAEFETMKRHTVIGDRLCGELRLLSAVRPIVRSHHERLDGTGYPDNLRGDSISLLAQILAIVDIYDALTTTRCYRPALPAERAFEQLEEEVRNGWRSKDLVREFITLARSLTPSTSVT